MSNAQQQLTKARAEIARWSERGRQYIYADDPMFNTHRSVFNTLNIPNEDRLQRSGVPKYFPVNLPYIKFN